jgi:tripartite-type tricarboxylate transporter receptor subunit TctC
MKAPSRRSLLAGAAALAASAPLHVRAYPERSITLVVPFAAGGSTDILARIVCDHLQRSLKQPVIVENRTGGNIGTAAVARSAPDGYTLLFNTMSVHTMNRALFAAMPFDGVNDFSPITLLAYVTNTMVTHPSVPAANVAEFIAHAKANPGRLAYASAGAGSTNHLCGALLEKMAGISCMCPIAASGTVWRLARNPPYMAVSLRQSSWGVAIVSRSAENDERPFVCFLEAS